MKAGRWFRIVSLVAPSLLAARWVRGGERILHEVEPVLVMLFVVMIAALAMRFVEGRDFYKRHEGTAWRTVDVLTPTGVSVMWFAAGALLLAGKTGWASLSVVGILGLGTAYVATTWTALAACGFDRWRTAKFARSIVPEIATEGDPLREELVLRDVKIAAGTRLFITGRAMRHGVVSRYVVGADRSGGELKLASDLGPALRGEHHAPPLTLWLADVLGLTRSPTVYTAAVSFSVMPKPGAVDGAQQLLGAGGDAAVAHPAQQLPTEGTFRIREYVPGDDTRRIHWVRSAQQDQLVVRLPDEIPPADPMVRLILDNDLPGMDGLSTRAPDELLDAMVRVWLGIGRALAEKGTRVVLVTAGPHRGAMRRIEKQLHARNMRDSLKLGMRVTWQSSVPLEALVAKRGPKQIVVSARPRRSVGEVSWVVVPEAAWTSAEPPIPDISATTHPFPSGAPENRHDNRVRERKRVERMWQDRLALTHLVGWTNWLEMSGEHVARPRDGRISLGVIP